jgi:hypothetical protein
VAFSADGARPKEESMARAYTEETRRFMVFVHNAVVAALVEARQSHSYIADRWAEPRPLPIAAHDEGEARALAARSFPPQEGFVIDAVLPAGI